MAAFQHVELAFWQFPVQTLRVRYGYERIVAAHRNLARCLNPRQTFREPGERIRISSDDRGDVVLTAVAVKGVPAGVPINAVDSALGPNPENSPIILINCVDVCPIEAIVIRLLVLETFKCQRLSGEPVNARTQDS